MIAVMLLLAACGRPSPSAGGEVPDAVFPHSSEFVASHGLSWKSSPETCVQCHSPKAEESSAGPACSACHPAYPHGDDQHLGAVHGPQWAADRTACTACHGSAGERVPAESAPGACVGCHSPYPHDTAWTSPSAHGASVIAHGGAQVCGGCHPVAEATALCGSCHAAYPHPSGWARPADHGAAFLSGVSCGSGCHDGSEPTKVPGCAQCHDVFPHAEGWTTGHIPVVQSRGATTCERCHAPGALDGPRIPNTCATACHGEGS